MRLTPITNKGSLIWGWRSSGLISVVGSGNVQNVLWELILIISGSYFLNGLRDITMKQLIGIREFIEQLAIYCFNHTIPTDNTTWKNNIPPHDEVNEGETVSICHALHLPSSISTSAVAITIFDITLNSVSSISYNSVISTIGYQNTA